MSDFVSTASNMSQHWHYVHLVFQISSSSIPPPHSSHQYSSYRKASCWYLAFYLIEWKYGEEQHQACWILNYNNTEEWCFDKFLTTLANPIIDLLWGTMEMWDVINCANITPTLGRTRTPGLVCHDLCWSWVGESPGLTLWWWWSIAANNLIRTNTYYDCFCLQFWP